MAHKELKRQYEEDCKNHDRPWELWEILHDGIGWRTCTNPPSWSLLAEYRRKEGKKEDLKIEYFSGLNWREAEKLIGKVVEFSDEGTVWSRAKKLRHVASKEVRKFYNCDEAWVYIRTCHETYKHPTITIGGIELPKPEAEAPEKGTDFWIWAPDEIEEIEELTWCGDPSDEKILASGIVHLTQDRAQAWADWWENTVIKRLR